MEGAQGPLVLGNMCSGGVRSVSRGVSGVCLGVVWGCLGVVWAQTLWDLSSGSQQVWSGGQKWRRDNLGRFGKGKQWAWLWRLPQVCNAYYENHINLISSSKSQGLSSYGWKYSRIVGLDCRLDTTNKAKSMLLHTILEEIEYVHDTLWPTKKVMFLGVTFTMRLFLTLPLGKAPCHNLFLAISVVFNSHCLNLC